MDEPHRQITHKKPVHYYRHLLLVVILGMMTGCATVTTFEIGAREEVFEQYKAVWNQGENLTMLYDMTVEKASGGHERMVRWSKVPVSRLQWITLGDYPYIDKSEEGEIRHLMVPDVPEGNTIPLSTYHTADEMWEGIRTVTRNVNSGSVSAHVVTDYWQNSIFLARASLLQPGYMEVAEVRIPVYTEYREQWAYSILTVALPIAVAVDYVFLPVNIYMLMTSLPNMRY